MTGSGQVHLDRTVGLLVGQGGESIDQLAAQDRPAGGRVGVDGDDECAVGVLPHLDLGDVGMDVDLASTTVGASARVMVWICSWGGASTST